MRTKIAKFGFEIEGEFSENTLDLLRGEGVIKTDGSIHVCRTHVYKTDSDYEFNSNPMKLNVTGRRQTRKIFDILQEAYEKKEYHWNKTMGFHIHVSFTPKKPPEIFSSQFASQFEKLIRTKFSSMVRAREKNQYCRIDCSDENIAYEHDKYTFINFNSAYSEHGTIEFRIFASNNPKTMRRYLSTTLRFVAQFLRKDLSVDFNAELEDMPHNQEYNLDDVGRIRNDIPVEINI